MLQVLWESYFQNIKDTVFRRSFMIYLIAFTLGVSSFFHPCFIGTITTFYTFLVLMKEKKKFILGCFSGILIINFLFLFFTDILKYIFQQQIFNYIIGGLFIFFGLMFLGIIKHKHSNFLLSAEKLEKTNPIFIGILIAFSWIQSFAHTFIPMVPMIPRDNIYSSILMILFYSLGLTIPVILFKFSPLKINKKNKQNYTKAAGIILVVLGTFITFNLFEEIEQIVKSSHSHNHHNHDHSNH